VLCDFQVVSKYTEYNHGIGGSNQVICLELVYAKLWPDKTISERVFGEAKESDDEHNKAGYLETASMTD